MRHSSQTTGSQKLLRPTFLIPYHYPWSDSESLSDSDSDSDQ